MRRQNSNASSVKALEKDRKLRYQSASDLRADLHRLKRDTDSARVAALSRLVHAAGARPWWRRKTVLGAGSLVLAALLALGTWFAVFRGRGEAIDSLAVLPFVNASTDPNSEYLSDGISESIINNLSQLSNLRVMARTTVFRYKGKEIDPQKIGHDLNVRAMVTGRVQQHGDNLIIQAELVDVEKGSQLWGGQFNRKLADVIGIQEEISKEISEKLRLKLSGDEKQRVTKRQTENAEAYQVYLKGLYYFYKATPEATLKAREYFQQAIDRDPGYALAYAGLAGSYVYQSECPPREAMPKAQAAARRALELDDRLAEAHVSMALVNYRYEWDWEAAGKHFEQAIKLNPASPLVHLDYANYLGALGRSNEALEAYRKGAELDPVSPLITSGVAGVLYFTRRFDEAIEQARKALDIDPSLPPAIFVLGLAYAAKGMYREALAEFEKYPPGPRRDAYLAYLRARLGERNQALQMLDQLKGLSKERYVPAFSFAVIYLGLGEKDQAFAWLEKAYEDRSSLILFLKGDPIWDPLRSDLRFADLLRRIGLPQ